MRFSLVLATIGRTDCLIRFLDSLDRQTHRDFHLIVVDQNPDDRLLSILSKYETNFQLQRIRCGPGLSRARNAGLPLCRGDIIAFPDDDCWYPDDLLSRINSVLEIDLDIAGLSGMARDETGAPTAGRWKRNRVAINRTNVWNTGISFSIFLRKSVINTASCFDESLGAGSGTPWGSGEETDYLIRALDLGHRIIFEPEIFVFHPNPATQFCEATIKRAFNYGAGMGRVMKKHSYPGWYVAYLCARPLVACLLALGRGDLDRSRFFFTSMQGRFTGWSSTN